MISHPRVIQLSLRPKITLEVLHRMCISHFEQVVSLKINFKTPIKANCRQTALPPLSVTCSLHIHMEQRTRRSGGPLL